MRTESFGWRYRAETAAVGRRTHGKRARSGADGVLPHATATQTVATGLVFRRAAGIAVRHASRLDAAQRRAYRAPAALRVPVVGRLARGVFPRAATGFVAARTERKFRRFTRRLSLHLGQKCPSDGFQPASATDGERQNPGNNRQKREVLMVGPTRFELVTFCTPTSQNGAVCCVSESI